ncbi:hypothetical protein SBC1_73950 (plasmid) [Caballeronia sp. SBC1]|nr:hypothetical protein SBC2_72330 [Caballeronia sp. SBC2]QIN67348.1 hypothetical protein SBC1_73950 [Caballeronia sp. SBC1]
MSRTSSMRSTYRRNWGRAVHDSLPDAAGNRRVNLGGNPRRGTSGLNLGVVASLVLAFSSGAGASPTTYTVVIEQMRFNLRS